MADVELPSGETDLSAISLSADDVLLVLEGTQTVDTGVTAHNTTDLQRVYIGPNFRGSFGTAASPVDLKVSNTTTDSDPRIEIEGGAYVNLCSSGGIDKLVSDMPPGATLALGTGASAIAVLQALGGLLNITAGALVTNLYAWGAEQVILKQHATTALTIFEAAAGLILCERSAATVKCHHDAIFRLMESAAVSTLADIRGGVFNHRSRGTVRW